MKPFAVPYSAHYNVLRRAGLVSSYLVILFSGLTLLGWHLDLTWLKGWEIGAIFMNPITALGLIFSSLSIVFSVQNEVSASRKIARLFCWLVLAIAIFKLLSAVSFLPIQVDHLLYTHKPTDKFGNPMAVSTAICFALLSLSLFFGLMPASNMKRLGQACVLVVVTIAFFILIGYLYGVDVLYHYLSFSPMAFNTTLCFLLLAFAALLLQHKPLTYHIFTRYKGGKMARLLLPLSLLVPVSLGFLKIWGVQHHWYTSPVGIALFTLINIIILIMVIFSAAISLNHFELQLRRQIEQSKIKEQQLTYFKQGLEGVIEARNAELYRSERRFRSLIENSSDAITLVDRNGIVLYQTPSAEKIFGFSFSEREGTSIFMNLTAEAKAAASGLLQHALARPGISISFSSTVFHKDGSLIEVEGKVNNLLDDPSVAAIVINYSDVTMQNRLRQQLEQEQQEKQREIMRSVVNAEERERSKFGEELHDNINQMMASVKLYLEMAIQDEAQRKELLIKGKEVVTSTIEEIRKLSRSMVTPVFEQNGFLDSVSELTALIARARAIYFEIRAEGFREDLLKQGHKILLYRIIQEQLNNILKHAQARHVVIAFQMDGPELHLRITDDGVGFDSRQVRKGIGLNNIQNRVSFYNGKVHIHSEKNKGTSLHVIICWQG